MSGSPAAALAALCGLLLVLAAYSTGFARRPAPEPQPARPAPPRNRWPVLIKPFDGDYPLVNFFDHDLPRPFQKHNGYQLTFWGERVRAGYDGHDGYDWAMPEGTPVLAAAPGTILFAGTAESIYCGFTGSKAPGALTVRIEHPVPDGSGLVKLVTGYAHLSKLLVGKGQQVKAGDPVGLSGNTGCSEAPHLHLATWTETPATGGKLVTIDPFGWKGGGSDPWAGQPDGAASLWLWEPGREPLIFGESADKPNSAPGSGSAVAVTRVRWTGYDDGRNPNNEFVEISTDPDHLPLADIDLSGFEVRNLAGDFYRFAAGTRLKKGHSIRIYSGRGQDTAHRKYWGRTHGVWNNLGDCAQIVTDSGNVLYRFHTQKDSCPAADKIASPGPG